MLKTNASQTSLISITCKLFVNILDDFSMIIYLNTAFEKQALDLFLLILSHMAKLLTKLFTFASFMSSKKNIVGICGFPQRKFTFSQAGRQVIMIRI